MTTNEIEALTSVIANMVFQYQGSDPEVKKKQTGLKMAVETLQEALLEYGEKEYQRGKEEEKRKIENNSLIQVASDSTLPEDELIVHSAGKIFKFKIKKNKPIVGINTT